MAKSELGLREAANDAIAQAAFENDSKKAEIAVISYSLGKLLSKAHFQRSKNWPRVADSILREINEAVSLARSDEFGLLEKKLSSVVSTVAKVDFEFGNYWQNLIEKARVKQASSAYALGLSLSQACGLTCCDKQALFNYIGFTKMHEETPVLKNISERVDRLKELLAEKKP